MNSHSKWSGAFERSAHLLSGIVISALVGCSGATNSIPVPQGKLSLSPRSNELQPGQSTALVASDTVALPTGITWSLSCGSADGVSCGQLSSSGTTYTAPDLPPVGNETTITASAGDGETASTIITVDNPKPAITSVSPSSFSAGSAQIQVTGSGFVPGSLVQVQSGQATLSGISVLSTTEITANLNVPVYASGALSLTVENPSPGKSTSAPGTITINSGTVSYDAAVRFLKQATFGPTPTLIAHVQRIGFSAFVDEQLSQPPSLYPWAEYGGGSSSIACSMMFNAVNGPDQLRQRLSFALNEIIVASAIGSKININAFPTWENVLQTDALTTYPQLLSDALQNYALGVWLDNNRNWITSANQHASQNMGRELLQLFTIGPYLLNMDGSVQTDSNSVPIPSYSPATIDGISRALTGWGETYILGPQGQHGNAEPMIWSTWAHDETAKQLLNGLVTSPGQNAEQDLNTVLNSIASHQNLAPFISRRLIQALVTSNPSPEYIERIAKVFANDGSGTVGNLKTVVKAILLDPEARAGDSSPEPSTFGHVQEPFLYFAGVLRATGAQIGNVGPPPSTYSICSQDNNVIQQWLLASGQEPFDAPSVFNFYQFNNMLSGSGTIYAPEMQIMNASTVFARLDFLNDLLFGSSALSKDSIQDQQWEADAQSSPDQLVLELSHLLIGQSLDSTIAGNISDAVNAIPPSDADARVRQAIYLIAASGQYQTIH